ncbi:helix-turn-helix domain-containing protein [Arthrobacter globiformis]|uniref:helix-turn-helix domain-containing protein n=1 Tax=Arthrobacter globiformis TaxID=1665 RepID=UPI00278037BD|nr:helix-turn-helix domain-containing protein [Arthrobacter globiformis]MDQ0865723.1 excisionase family DNA binding protein [Arthrobacter globiformis]
MTTPQRPPSAYVHGLNGPVVVIPARVCAWLERYARLNEVRIQERGSDPEVDAVLVAVRLAALTWRTTATGTPVAAKPEVDPDLKQWMSTGQAADKLGITDRAVRLAIQEQRLHANNINGRWRITQEDLQHFTAAKNAATAA